MLFNNQRIVFILRIIIFIPFLLFADTKEYSFGVLPQRSAVATSEIWNPIFDYVEHKTGVRLVLKTTRTGSDSKQATDAGEYDFTYSNVIFDAKHIIYIPILQPNTAMISGQIVTLNDSAIKTINDLNGKQVGFPSQVAFVGYQVPTDYLKKQHISFVEVFGGNQEGIMAQLKSGAVQAAAVNNAIMKAYADREKLKYNILWESKKFPDIPIAAHKRVPQDVVKKVQSAIAGMSSDKDGKKILQAIIDKTKQPTFGFLPANLKTYQPYLDFYKKSDK